MTTFLALVVLGFAFAEGAVHVVLTMRVVVSYMTTWE